MKKDPNVFFDRNSFYSSHKNLNQFGTSKQHVCQLGVSIITTILKAFETFNPRKALSTDENTCGARAKNNKLDQSGKHDWFRIYFALLPIQIPINSDPVEKRNAINLYLPITLITSSKIILILIKSFKTRTLFQKQSLISYVQEELRKSLLKCGTYTYNPNIPQNICRGQPIYFSTHGILSQDERAALLSLS